MHLKAANVHEAKPLPVLAGLTAATLESRAASTCQDLLERFSRKTACEAQLLDFDGVGAQDVYNITAPFQMDGARMIAGRVERRDSEVAQLTIFREQHGKWVSCHASPMLRSLQDPCVTFVSGELILGGVRYPVEVPGGKPTWRMEFFRGHTLSDLQPWLVGPARMKDIRFCELPDGRIAVFSRPQGLKGGKGKIGFCIADSLEDISAEMIDEAPLLDGQFAPGEWGGANEAQVLADGSIGVLGHIARWDHLGKRHYYPMAFTIDPATRCTTPVRIIATRDLFPVGPAKREDLVDVVFSGGLERHDNGYATLWAGLSDASAGVLKIEDPFSAAIVARLGTDSVLA